MEINARSPVCCRLQVVILVILLSGFTGCQTPMHNASELPAELAAPYPLSAQRINLSRLSIPSDRWEIIQPDDLLNVTVASGLEESDPPTWQVRVTNQGVAELPLIGPVRLAGADLSSAGELIREASVQREIYRHPQVSVRLESRRIHKVTILGAVEKPGTYELPAYQSDLSSAIAAAGGFEDEADTVVEIRHQRGAVATTPGGYPNSGPPANGTIRVDLAEITARGDRPFPLDDGAVVTVMKQPLRAVYVLGLVNTPGRYDMPNDRDVRLLDAVAMAGGRTLEVADKVLIVRHLPNQKERTLVRASILQAKRNEQANLRLAAGDVVSIEETPLTFTLEALRSLTRFGFSAGIPGL